MGAQEMSDIKGWSCDVPAQNMVICVVSLVAFISMTSDHLNAM